MTFADLKERAKTLKRQVHTLYFAYQDPRVPWYAKVFAACVVAYALSPVDLIPDFIPILGYIDEIILIPFCIAIAVKMIPQDAWKDAEKRAQQSNNAKVNWIVGACIIVIWLIIASFAIRWLLQFWRGQ